MRATFEFLRTRPAETAIALLIIAHVVPVWMYAYFPTQDGPSHVANALILKEHASNALYQEYFRIEPTPLPNWFSHASLALLLHAVSPLIAEKILLTLYAVAFPLSVFYLIDAVHPGKRMPGFLGFVFMYHYPLHLGFYNFSFSIAAYLFAVGYWWKHRDHFDWRCGLGLNLALVFTYFCHLVSVVLAFPTLFLLAAATTRRRNLKARLALPFALIPAYVLPVWYLWQGAPGPALKWPADKLLEFLLGIGSLASYEGQTFVARLVFLALVALALYTAVERFNVFGWTAGRGRLTLRFQASDAFWLVFVLLVGAYFSAPDVMAGGTYITARLALFPFLLLLPALSPQWRAPLFKPALAVLLALLIALQWRMNAVYYRTLNVDLEEYMSGLAAVEPGKTFMALTFEPQGALPGSRIGALQHAGAYYAAATGGVDLGNYEADSVAFPVRFNPALRAGQERPRIWVMEAMPKRVDPRRYCARTDYILTWKMDPDLPLAERIREHYTELFTSTRQRLRIFARKPAGCRPTRD